MLMHGEVIEIVGRLSSGRTSLLTAWLTSVTRGGGLAALVDADGAFDPQSAARAGADLRRLLWVRTDGRRDTALRAADLLVRCRGLALVAIDLGESPPRLSLAAAFRLRLAARRAGITLVILAARRIAGASATLAVRTARCALEWSGGRRPTRLARVATRVEVLRGHAPVAAAHWWCA
jgi:RecA/RadA recombinase